MNKRIFSFILSFLILLTCFAPCVFADSSQVSGLNPPDPSCEHDWKDCNIAGWEFEYKELHISVDVTRCSKCNVYKHALNVLGFKFTYYSLSGLKTPDGELLDFLNYNLAIVLGKFSTATKVPSGIGRKNLPGYEDDSGTAHVSKEGKLKFVAHPCWLDVGEQESNKFTLTDPYKPYRVEEEDEDYGLYVYDWLGYNNGISHFSLYTQPLSDDMSYGNFDFYWIIDSGFVPGTYYVAADQPTVKNYYSKYGAEPQILKTKAGEYNLPNDSYWGLGNLGLSDYNAVWHERRWFYAENAKSTSIDIYLYPFLVTCDPTENPVEEKKEVTIEDNKFTGNIYVDNSTNITYIYPKYTTVNVNNETVIEVADHPLIYNPESKTYYIYDQTTNGVTISKTTCYRYIQMKLFPSLRYKHLPQGHPKKGKGTVSHANVSHPKHRSIEHRAKSIRNREEVGHWELDSVIGKAEGTGESCLVMTDRKTRGEIIIKARSKTAADTVHALQWLKCQIGRDWKLIFHTITNDNGSEFADQDGIDALGVTTFYCHPQSPHERGTNEVTNKLVRRKLPKGKSMAKVTQKQATEVQHWVNHYTRPMFGGKSAAVMLKEELDKLPLYNREKVYRFFDLL